MEQSSKNQGFDVITSRQFSAWLAGQNASLAFTTYETGKLFLIGLKLNGRLSVFSRNLSRAMGLWSDGQTIYLGTSFQLWRFENLLEPGQRHQGYDRLYAPMSAVTTGDIDIHDIGVEPSGRVVFVNTLFSCLATPSERQSFQPIWQPPFISALAPEDRCHLNGLAMKEGQITHASSISRSDVASGWRQRRGQGGVLLDVNTNTVVLEGLSMPHSPRWHQGQLYFLESGTGFLCRADLERHTFERLVFVPGYLRGLAFLGDWAIIGASKPRANRTFSDLELDANLRARDAEPRCGLFILDLRTGSVMDWLNIEGAMGEMYDVAVLPGVECATALGFKTNEIQRTIKLGPRLWTGEAPKGQA